MKIELFAMVAVLSSVGFSGCSNTPSEAGNKQVTENEAVEMVWEFDDADGWAYFHQDTATVDQWAITDGKLALTTRANTYDRTKMHTADNTFAAGVYRWRTYVPAITIGEQVSIGSWIYHDDHHELDFEVGPGKAEIRQETGVAADELLACMTNQDLPFKSGYTPIKPGWHDFEIRLDVAADGNYLAIWSIDGVEKQRLKLEFGPEICFTIQCSVENLKFIGDHISASDYTALYDRVSFSGQKSVQH